MAEGLNTKLWFVFQVIFALNQTLLQQESLRAGGLQVPYTTEHLIKHYNCGDLNSIIFNHDTSQVLRSRHRPAQESHSAWSPPGHFTFQFIPMKIFFRFDSYEQIVSDCFEETLNTLKKKCRTLFST